MSRIVLATTGSIGDLRPYLAVGAGLRSRGHSIAVATASAYRQEVENNGLEFCPVRPFVAPCEYKPEVFRRANDLKTGSTYLVREMVLPNVDEMYADLLAACRGANLLLIHPILFAAPAAAEKLNIKWISVMLAPGSLSSAYDPPVMPPVSWLHGLRHLGPLPNRLLIKALRAITRSWMKPIDDLRAREGLAPARDNPIQMFSPHGTLALFSRVLGQPQPDWAPHTVLTGFPFYDNGGGALDPTLREFLDRGVAGRFHTGIVGSAPPGPTLRRESSGRPAAGLPRGVPNGTRSGKPAGWATARFRLRRRLCGILQPVSIRRRSGSPGRNWHHSRSHARGKAFAGGAVYARSTG